MIESKHRLLGVCVSALIALFVVLLLGVLFGGLQWRDRVLVVRNPTGEKVGVMVYRSVSEGEGVQREIHPWETVEITFARGNEFLPGVLVSDDMSMLEFDYRESERFKPGGDAYVDVVPDEDGEGLRLVEFDPKHEESP